MDARQIGYGLSITIGAGLGAFFGFVASMWGGLYVILPVCTVIGAAFGYLFAFIIEIIVT